MSRLTTWSASGESCSTPTSYHGTEREEDVQRGASGGGGLLGRRLHPLTRSRATVATSEARAARRSRASRGTRTPHTSYGVTTAVKTSAPIVSASHHCTRTSSGWTTACAGADRPTAPRAPTAPAARFGVVGGCVSAAGRLARLAREEQRDEERRDSTGAEQIRWRGEADAPATPRACGASRRRRP